MMKNLVLTLLVLLSACASNEVEKENSKPDVSNSVISNGDSKISNQVCGDIGLWLRSVESIEGKLRNSYQSSGGAFGDVCDIAIDFTKNGEIEQYWIIDCEKGELLNAVLSNASPIDVPDNACLYETLQSQRYSLGQSRINQLLGN